jgi:flagellar assembly protein FliH
MMNSFTNPSAMRGSSKHEFEPMFGGRGAHSPNAAPVRRKALTEEDLNVARQEGVVQGQAQANASIERQASESLRAIAGMMQMMLGRLGEEARTLRQDAAEVAVAAARAVSGAALDEFGQEAIEDIVGTAVAQLRETPRLVVRVAPSLVETIEQRLIVCAREAGFNGEIAIRGDDNAAPGDCVLDWSDGTITHNRAAAFEAIEQAAQRWLTSAQSAGFQIDMFKS